MRKFAAVSGAALLLGAGFGLASPFGSANAHGGHEMVLTEKEVTSTETDLGEKGKFDAGDRFSFVSDLLDQDGKKVGTDGGDCGVVQVVSEQDVSVVCTVGLILDGGTIMISTYSPFSEDFDVAITGGTGKYAEARGVVNVVSKDDMETSTLTIRLAG